MGLKVAFIEPTDFKVRGIPGANKGKGHNIFPNIGLAYLTAVLEKKHEIEILDTYVSSSKEIREFIRKEFDVYGLAATSWKFKDAIAFTKVLKKVHPNSIVVFGGPHTTVAAETILEENPEIDYAVMGEGEETFAEFLDAIEKKKDISGINGMIWRKNGKTVINAPRCRLANLDELPFPAFQYFRMKRYRQHPILTSRGCPYNCDFCNVPTVWGRKYTMRTAKNLVDEIDYVVKRWGKKAFHINDDNFTLINERVEQFCDELLRRKIKINWLSQGVRADRTSLTMLKKMRRAGCSRISIGVEAADDEVLKKMGKNETLAQIEQSIKWTHQAGITVLGLFMIGNPGDTFEIAKKNIAFIDKAKIELPSFNLAIPYPKTKLWDYIGREGRWINKDYTNYNLFSAEPVFDTPYFPAEERKLAYMMSHKKFTQLVIKHHLLFFFPTHLIKRNWYEISEELKFLFARKDFYVIGFNRLKDMFKYYVLRSKQKS
ncbi:MAG: B12-binding domain-containing radical SAM protein [bacterium]|nr:B12-binding domain-containing radical SAM protein [bacterium]